MTFVSEVFDREPVVKDDKHYALSVPEGYSKGLMIRDKDEDPIGGFAKAFDLPLIPRSEWASRIEEIERTKSRLSDISYAAGIECLDQNGTNYCWANAPVYCVELLRLASGLGDNRLSPASVAAPIKNYQNRGGWGTQALKYIVNNGIVPADKWPCNAIDRAYYTEENKIIAKEYSVTEWYDLEDKNFEQLMTCLILRIPVAVGYNWWLHEVSAIDALVLGKDEFGIRIRNSWGMRYGKDGYAILTEEKAASDDAVAPRVAISYPEKQ